MTEWNLPFGVPLFAWTVGLNTLSVCFQLALSLLAAAVSVYSFGYLRKMEGRRNTGILGFFYNVMPLSLTLVFAAANVLLFPSGVRIYALRTQTFLQSARRIGRGGAI